jgi:hypothetical protein
MTTSSPDELAGPATVEEVLAEERKLGVPFPTSLKEYLLRHNGGRLYGGLVRLYSVGSHDYNFSAQNEDLREVDSWPSGLIAFATDGGLGLFSFDSRRRYETGEYDLYYWSWEERTPEPVGSSFQDWLKHLEKLAAAR